jgi:hypothetical protein
MRTGLHILDPYRAAQQRGPLPLARQFFTGKGSHGEGRALVEQIVALKKGGRDTALS